MAVVLAACRPGLLLLGAAACFLSGYWLGQLEFFASAPAPNDRLKEQASAHAVIKKAGSKPTTITTQTIQKGSVTSSAVIDRTVIAAQAQSLDPVPVPAPVSVKPTAPATIIASILALPSAAHGIEAGFLVATGPRPAWLLKKDLLLMAPSDHATQGSKILILQTVLMDNNGEWGHKDSRPGWLRACLATNREHARKHGHTMILRHQPSQPQLTPWEVQMCGPKTSTADCTKQWERENFNWEKHLQLSEYLESPENFTHILMLDADAALVHPESNTLQQMALELKIQNKQLFLSDEDWLKNGEGRINGGLLFAQNTPFTRAVFRDTFDAHVIGPGRGDRGLENWRIGLKDVRCGGNEQDCLNQLKGKPQFSPHIIVASGKKYNRGGCVLHRCGEPTTEPNMQRLGMGDPDLEILHFMGGSKHAAMDALCKDKRGDLTGLGPNGYGCNKK